ncbi:hypothetical protein ACJX0J_007110, partial [Zea mays]
PFLKVNHNSSQRTTMGVIFILTLTFPCICERNVKLSRIQKLIKLQIVPLA